MIVTPRLMPLKQAHLTSLSHPFRLLPIDLHPPKAANSYSTCAPPVVPAICPKRAHSSACLLTSRLPTLFGEQFWSRTFGMELLAGGPTRGFVFEACGTSHFMHEASSCIALTVSQTISLSAFSF